MSVRLRVKLRTRQVDPGICRMMNFFVASPEEQDAINPKSRPSHQHAKSTASECKDALSNSHALIRY